ncbi:hypothetical protein F5Y04DRAFT_79666 [Hypomontagnella monticulosa]|nr:hypothetical protein F5Y04DRAFT_79666 [Hypomontagnella monticulosa]
MERLLLFATLLAIATAKVPYAPLSVDGASYPSGLDLDTIQAITYAQQNPNSTRSITFKPFEPAQNSPISAIKDTEWTWRVNVTDFPAPGAENEKVADPHVVSTTYDFSWPGGGNLTSQLNDPSAGLCLAFVDSPSDPPVNVTNAYTEDDTKSPSCAHALGKECALAILTKGRITGSPGSKNCKGPATSWFDLPECRSTLGYALTSYGIGNIATFGIGFENGTTTNNTYRQSGDGWAGTFSDIQSGSGSKAYYTAANRLHIVMLNPILPTGEGDGAFAQATELYCMRVNATQLPTKGPNGDGVPFTSEVVMGGAGNGDNGNNDGDKGNMGSVVNSGAGWALFVASFMSLSLIFIA